jgi:GT2 family glycosyltransferase
MVELSQMTAIIKTFQRPRSLDRLIASIRRFYPGAGIAVADDGYTPATRTDVDYLRLPLDVGLSAGRNALLRHIQTPYFLILDDDLEFTRHTSIEILLELVASGVVDLAGGDYLRCKHRLLFVRQRRQPFHGVFRYQDDDLHLAAASHASYATHLRCDFVHNFFVARTEQILGFGGWDEELKLNEHVEFFVRAQRAGIRVGYCPQVVARHWMERPAGYAQYRDRDFTRLAAAKIGVSTVRRFDGQPIAGRLPTAA